MVKAFYDAVFSCIISGSRVKRTTNSVTCVSFFYHLQEIDDCEVGMVSSDITFISGFIEMGQLFERATHTDSMAISEV